MVIRRLSIGGTGARERSVVGFLAETA